MIHRFEHGSKGVILGIGHVDEHRRNKEVVWVDTVWHIKLDVDPTSIGWAPVLLVLVQTTMVPDCDGKSSTMAE